MRSPGDGHPDEHQRGGGCPSRTLLDKAGLTGLITLVWHSIPLPLRLFAFPYAVVVYWRLLDICCTLDQLQLAHAEKYDSSLVFRLLRPRYHRITHLFARFVEDEDTLAGGHAPSGDGHQTSATSEEADCPESSDLDAFFDRLFVAQDEHK